jgi:hypothetical protein
MKVIVPPDPPFHLQILPVPCHGSLLTRQTIHLVKPCRDRVIEGFSIDDGRLTIGGETKLEA